MSIYRKADKYWYFQIIEIYSRVKMKEACLNVATWMNSRNIMLIEKKQIAEEYIQHDTIL